MLNSDPAVAISGAASVPPRSHVAALTSLRFVAALLVFIHHFMCVDGWSHFPVESFWALQTSTMAMLLYELRYGVTLFFVLSGFLLTVRYYDSLFTRISLGGYWVRRIARILPLYWTLLTIMLGYYLWRGMSTEHFPIFYSLTQGFFVDVKWEGIGTAWSLTVEECFYLLLPLMIVTARLACLVVDSLDLGLRTRWLHVVVGGVVILAFVELAWSLGEGLHRADVWEYAGFLQDKDDMRTYTIFGRLSDFGVGMFAGLIYLKTRNSVLRKGWLADIMIAVSATLIGYHCVQIYLTGNEQPAWDNLETHRGAALNVYNAVFSGVMIYFLCSSRSLVTRLLSVRPLRYLGEISFAMYLVHFNHISYGLYEWVGGLEWGFLASALVLYVFFTVVSAVCYELIERPAQHLILEKAGVLQGSVRRPTILRWLGFARRSKPRPPKADPPASSGGGLGAMAMAC